MKSDNFDKVLDLVQQIEGRLTLLKEKVGSLRPMENHQCSCQTRTVFLGADNLKIINDALVESGMALRECMGCIEELRGDGDPNNLCDTDRMILQNISDALELIPPEINRGYTWTYDLYSTCEGDACKL